MSTTLNIGFGSLSTVKKSGVKGTNSQYKRCVHVAMITVNALHFFGSFHNNTRDLFLKIANIDKLKLQATTYFMLRFCSGHIGKFFSSKVYF